MESEELIYREVDTTVRVYPPPVYYGLTLKGKGQATPQAFALALTEILEGENTLQP